MSMNNIILMNKAKLSLELQIALLISIKFKEKT